MKRSRASLTKLANTWDIIVDCFHTLFVEKNMKKWSLVDKYV